MSEESGSASSKLQPDNVPAGLEVSSKSSFTLFWEETFLWTSGFYFMHFQGCNWSCACWTAMATPEVCWYCLCWKSKLCWEMATVNKYVRQICTDGPASWNGLSPNVREEWIGAGTIHQVPCLAEARGVGLQHHKKTCETFRDVVPGERH